MNVEELEMKVGFKPVGNEVRIKDKQGNEVIYKGLFYDLQFNEDLNVFGNVSFKKTKKETIIKEKFLRKNKPEIIEKKIWYVNTRTQSKYCRFITNGNLNLESSHNYISKLECELINEKGIVVSKKLRNAVFSDMEKQLLEQYQKIMDAIEK